MKKIIKYSLIGIVVLAFFYGAEMLLFKKNLSEQRDALSCFFEVSLIALLSVLITYLSDRYVAPIDEKQKYVLLRIAFFCLVFFYIMSLIFRHFLVNFIVY